MTFLKYSALAALLPLALVATLAFAGATEAAGTAVPLGTAGSFVVLAGAGDHQHRPDHPERRHRHLPDHRPKPAPASLTITGTNHAGDAVTQQAKTDLVTAYNSAAGQGPTTPVPADLGGQTLTPGVYNSASALGLTGNLTLERGRRPERGLRLPGRLDAHDRLRQLGQPDQRRPGLQRLLAGRQLGDPRHRVAFRGTVTRPDETSR